MPTWTNKPKGKLSWKAPEKVAATGEAYELEIADGFFLDIGGHLLTIQPENAETSWEHTPKHKLSFPQPVTELTTQLDIGDGFEMNIGDGFTLDIGQQGPSGTPWTKTGKTGR